MWTLVIMITWEHPCVTVCVCAGLDQEHTFEIHFPITLLTGGFFASWSNSGEHKLDSCFTESKMKDILSEEYT